MFAALKASFCVQCECWSSANIKIYFFKACAHDVKVNYKIMTDISARVSSAWTFSDLIGPLCTTASRKADKRHLQWGYLVMAVCMWVFSVGPGVPPASERLLQVDGHLQGQVVLQLPANDLQTQGQTLLTHTQGTLGDRQPEDVDYTWRSYVGKKQDFLQLEMLRIVWITIVSEL